MLKWTAVTLATVGMAFTWVGFGLELALAVPTAGTGGGLLILASYITEIATT